LREFLPRDSVAAVRLFLPYPRSVALRRGAAAPFRLGSTDAAERRDMLAQGFATLEAADEIAAPLVLLPVVELGDSARAGLPCGFVDPTRDGGLDPNVASARRDEARARFDGMLLVVEKLADRAERYGLRLAMTVTNRAAELPRFDEVRTCFDELRGAPLDLWVDTARWPVELLDVPAIGAAASGSGGDVAELPVAGVSVRDVGDDGESALPGRGRLDWALLAPSLARWPVAALDLAAGAAPDDLAAGLEFLREHTGDRRDDDDTFGLGGNLGG